MKEEKEESKKYVILINGKPKEVSKAIYIAYEANRKAHEEVKIEKKEEEKRVKHSKRWKEVKAPSKDKERFERDLKEKQKGFKGMPEKYKGRIITVVSKSGKEQKYIWSKISSEYVKASKDKVSVLMKLLRRGVETEFIDARTFKQVKESHSVLPSVNIPVSFERERNPNGYFTSTYNVRLNTGGIEYDTTVYISHQKPTLSQENLYWALSRLESGDSWKFGDGTFIVDEPELKSVEFSDRYKQEEQQIEEDDLF